MGRDYIILHLRCQTFMEFSSSRSSIRGLDTSLSLSKQIPVRPFRHNEYERFIVTAFPYCGASFSTMLGFFIFSIIPLQQINNNHHHLDQVLIWHSSMTLICSFLSLEKGKGEIGGE